MLVGLYHLLGPIYVTLCDKIHGTSMWTTEFLLCHYNLVVLSHAHHRVVIEHEVAIGVVIRCFEREVGCLAFGSVCTFDRIYLGDKLHQVGASSSHNWRGLHPRGFCLTWLMWYLWLAQYSRVSLNDWDALWEMRRPSRFRRRVNVT